MTSLKKKEVLQIMLGNNDMNITVDSILTKIGINKSDVGCKGLERLKNALNSLKSKRNAKYQHCSRKIAVFESQNSEWLDSEFTIPDLDLTAKISKTEILKRGRPSLDFAEKSTRSKRREVSKISEEHDNDRQKLLMATSHAARVSGEADLRSVLNELSKSEEQAKKIRKIMTTPFPTIEKKSPEVALAFIFDNSMSKQVYQNMRLATKSSGADIWPAYNAIREAKEKLRPSKESIKISETLAEVSLQELLNHTVNRIIELQREVLHCLIQKNKITELKTVLMCSWGFDGSSGHSPYKQGYDSVNEKQTPTDENLFVTTLIPLRLSSEVDVILWNNVTSQSPRFCRPIQIRYAKESTEVILAQKKAIEEQILKLQAFEILIEGCRLKVQYTLLMTLIDGKVLNTITNTPSMKTCAICHAVPKQFNDLSNIKSVKFMPHEESLLHGISPLHAWIRIFEFCLHVSYKLVIKRWDVRGAKNKEQVALRKQEVQSILWEKMGLRVDKPKPGGSGTSNDGNTARRAFKDSKLLSDCLGLNHELLQRFKVILISLSCHLPLDSSRFEEFCTSTAKLYVSLYSWYPMSHTVHKILIHSGEIIKNSILPVGMLGEEASEARNKDYKKFRLQHSRKHSRMANLEDLFCRAMDTSDPLLSSLRLKERLQQKVQLSLPKEVQLLLKEVEVDSNQSGSTNYVQVSEELDEYEIEEIDFTEKILYLDDIELSEEEDSQSDVNDDI